MALDFRPQIEAAVDYGLTQERLPKRVYITERPYILEAEKWDRVIDEAERQLRREGVIRP